MKSSCRPSRQPARSRSPRADAMYFSPASNQLGRESTPPAAWAAPASGSQRRRLVAATPRTAQTGHRQSVGGASPRLICTGFLAVQQLTAAAAHHPPVEAAVAGATTSSGLITPPYAVPVRSRMVAIARKAPSGSTTGRLPVVRPALFDPKLRDCGRPTNAIATASPEAAVAGPSSTTRPRGAGTGRRAQAGR